MRSFLLAALAAFLALSCGSPSTVVTSTVLKTFLDQYGSRFPDPTAAPAITSITPKYGSTTKQTWSELKGTGFQLGATVTVGGVDCATIYVLTEETIDCLVQPHAFGTVDVTVTLQTGPSATLAASFTYL